MSAKKAAQKARFLGEYLEPTSQDVKVGGQTLKLGRLVIHRHRRFFASLSELSMDELGGAIKKAFDGGGMDGVEWLAKLSDVVPALGNVIASLGSDALGSAVAAVLDTETNFEVLKKNSCIPADTKAEMKAGINVYIGSQALRDWVELSCEIPQAVSIIHEAIMMNALDVLGKAGWGLMSAGWKKMTKGTKQIPAVEELVSKLVVEPGNDNSETTVIAG